MAIPTGPVHASSISNAAVSKQLDTQLTEYMKAFHKHSKTCSRCINPIHIYEAEEDLCQTGSDLCVKITTVLYRKAEFVEGGVFEISYRRGWEAVDGLIKIIAHYNQGHYSNTIQDIKRFPAIVPVTHRIEQARGSGFDEDIRRSRRNSIHRADNNRLSVYGNPRTSFGNINTNKPQASPTISYSSTESRRAVHFDTEVLVREFDA